MHYKYLSHGAKFGQFHSTTNRFRDTKVVENWKNRNGPTNLSVSFNT